MTTDCKLATCIWILIIRQCFWREMDMVPNCQPRVVWGQEINLVSTTGGAGYSLYWAHSNSVIFMNMQVLNEKRLWQSYWGVVSFWTTENTSFPELKKRKKKAQHINQTVKSDIQKTMSAAQSRSEHLHLRCKKAKQNTCNSGYVRI